MVQVAAFDPQVPSLGHAVDGFLAAKPLSANARRSYADTLARAGLCALDSLDSWSALVLAEHLRLPLFTASEEVTSTRITIRRPW